MALPATDTFTGANNDPLSANWTALIGSWKIWSNTAESTTSSVDNLAMWNADTFANDQYVQCVIVNVTSFNAGPALRLAATRGYLVGMTTTTAILYRLDAGVTTNIQDLGSSAVNGDVIRIEAEGSTIRVYKNSVQIGVDETDATYSSGAAGFTAYGAGTEIDTFEGGNLAPPAAQKITELTALTTPLVTDLLTLVDAPGGTAANKKVTITSLISTFALLTNAAVQTKTVGSGTYTPTAGMKNVLAIGVGGGGAGAGGINTDSAGGGGGGGGTVIRLLTAAQIGASKAYVVGAAGAATTLDAAGALLNAGLGGAGVAGATFSVVGVTTAGGTGGTAANGDLNIPGQPGERGVIFSGADGRGGKGGCSMFGPGGIPGGTNVAGGNGGVPGGGGAGGHASAATDRAGGAGEAGVLYFLEWLS